MQCIFFFFFPSLHLFTFSNWSPTSSTSHAIRENETSCAYIQTSCQVDRVTHQKSYVRKKKTTDVLFLTNNCTVEKRKRKKNKRNKKSVSGEGYQRNSEKKKNHIRSWIYSGVPRPYWGGGNTQFFWDKN